MSSTRHPASFRDPSGFLFERDGELLRQVNPSYQPEYEALINSGLYQACVERGWLIPHEEAEVAPAVEPAAAVLKPEWVPFISYPYEWSFSQLKDAALLTLHVQQLALKHQMSLKDASAYNVQFHKGRPLIIDSLSFERLQPGMPWVAYRQFCQHFLAPLALMAYRDVRMAGLLRSHIDGVPLDLAARCLPRTTLFRAGLLLHLHLHASAQRRTGDRELRAVRGREMSLRSLEGLISSLESTAEVLSWTPAGNWSDYYGFHNYTPEELETKRSLIGQFVSRIRPNIVWDLGANTGMFSRVAADQGADVVAMDNDPGAVEVNYLEAKANDEERVLPLLMDLTNPSPSLGWAHSERDSLLQRGPADLALALALIHHLAIGNNVPFSTLASFLSKAAHHLVIEFVPKTDPQVQKLLVARKDIFDDYTADSFTRAFEDHFRPLEGVPIGSSGRVLHLMESRTV